MKLLRAVLGVVHQQLTRLKLSSVQVSEAIHYVDDAIGAKGVHKAEWAAEEWREAQTEDCANVALELSVEGKWRQGI